MIGYDKGNILINEFMNSNKEYCSWCDLMEVVEKIETIGETKKRYGTLVDITTTYVKVGDELVDLKVIKVDKLNALFICIITFIFKYNEQEVKRKTKEETP